MADPSRSVFTSPVYLVQQVDANARKVNDCIVIEAVPPPGLYQSFIRFIEAQYLLCSICTPFTIRFPLSAYYKHMTSRNNSILLFYQFTLVQLFGLRLEHDFHMMLFFFFKYKI